MSDAGVVEEAIARARVGDRTALHYLYVRFAPDVRRTALAVVGDSHEAEDVTQDVFVRLTKAIPRYEPRALPFAAWLGRVARDTALDHLRTRRTLESTG